MRRAAALGVAWMGLGACRPDPGSTPPADPTAPARPRTPEQLGAGIELALADDVLCIRVGGRVHCGPNTDPTRSPVDEPALEGIDDAISIAVGRHFVCVATARGVVLCRGDNAVGQLGAGLAAPSSEVLVPVVGVEAATRVFAGPSHACAIVSGGRVRCWGENGFGQTGGPRAYAPEARELVTATAVAGVEGATVLALADSTSCAATTAGTVLCWGATAALREHATARGAASEQAVALTSLAGMDDLAAGDSLWCGIRSGAVSCWGELGAMPAAIRARAEQAGVDHTPVELGVPAATRVGMGSGHGCALLGDGAVWCWGANGGGALGRGSLDDAERVDPAVVRGLPPAVELFVGGSMSCIVTAEGAVHCWGRWPVVNGAPYRQSGTPVGHELRPQLTRGS